MNEFNDTVLDDGAAPPETIPYRRHACLLNQKTGDQTILKALIGSHRAR